MKTITKMNGHRIIAMLLFILFAQLNSLFSQLGVTIVADPGTSICSGNSITLFADTSGVVNPTAIVFLWNNGDITSSTTVNAAGTYSVTVGDTLLNQVASATITITAGSVPTWNNNPPVTVLACGGQSINITFDATATVKWTNNNISMGLSATSGMGNISFVANNPADSFIATISAYPELNGCKGETKTTKIRIISTPGSVTQNDITACVGQIIPKTVFTSNPKASEYTWMTSGANIGLTPNVSGKDSLPTFTVTGTGMTTVNVFGTNTYNNSGNMLTCKGPETTFKVTGTAPPTVTKPANASFCPGAQVTIPLTGTAGATFSWTNSNTAIGLPIGPGTGNIVFTPTNTGTTAITATITVTPKVNDNCVGTPVDFTITVNPKPVADIMVQDSSGSTANDGKICKGAPVTLSAGGTSCSWQGPAGLTPPNSCTWGNINLATTSAFTVVITNSFGCTATATKSITVQPDPGLKFQIENPCEGESFKLTSDPASFSSYAWKKDTVAIGSSMSTYTKNNVMEADSGVYALTAMDNQGCKWTYSQQIKIGNRPAPELAPEFTSVCRNSQAVYRVQNPSSPGVSQFKWEISPVSTSAYEVTQFGSILFVYWKTAGSYTVKVTESLGSTTTSSCFGDDNISVTVTTTNAPLKTDSIGHFKPNNILISKDSTAQCYQWGYFDPATLQFVELSGEIYQAYGAGEAFVPTRKYWVKTWNAADCSAQATCPTISFRVVPIDISIGDAPRLHLYPNPNAGNFLVEVSRLPEAEYTLVINDVLGRIVQQKQVQVGADGLLNETVQLDGAANGLYYVALRHDKGTLLAKAVSVFK